jgi:hypothetical protein
MKQKDFRSVTGIHIAYDSNDNIKRLSSSKMNNVYDNPIQPINLIKAIK